MFGKDGFEDAEKEIARIGRIWGFADLAQFTPPRPGFDWKGRPRSTVPMLHSLPAIGENFAAVLRRISMDQMFKKGIDHAAIPPRHNSARVSRAELLRSG
jgi:hypothetical protein